ncbi:hypothetical protein BH24ACI2_BH24ACI2_05200 [soil metagenome]
MSSNEFRVVEMKEGWRWQPESGLIDGCCPDFFEETSDLEFASAFGRIGIVKILIKAGADVNAINPRWSTTPLMAAASSGQAESVQLLIDSGAELETKKMGRTCLFNAVESRNKKTVQILINSGADVNVSDDWGITPLMCAVVGESIESAKMLLEAGANVNAADQNGNTAFDFVLRKRYTIPILGDFFTSGRNQEMLQLLEEAKLKDGK